MNAVAPCVVSPEQLVDLVEVLLKLPLDILQLVVVDGGVAPDADTCFQLHHERAHRFVLASRRRPCNAQTPQAAELTRWQLHLMSPTLTAAHAFTTFPP